ncbi:DNA replication complex GINS protein SLD5 [Chlorella vulgaris]
MASIQVWTFAGGLAQTVEQPGVFASDEAYVVLAGSDAAEQKLYLWAGASAPKDTLSIAATHAAELKASLGATYLRQQQGGEAPEFKQLFPNFEVAAAASAPAQADGRAGGGEEDAEGEEEADEAVDPAAGAAGKKKRRKKKKGGAAAAVAASEAAHSDGAAAVPSPPASPAKVPPSLQAGAATPSSPAALSVGAASFSPGSAPKAPGPQPEQEQEQEAPASPQPKQEAPVSPRSGVADSVSPPAAAATSPASAAKPAAVAAPVAAASTSPEPTASPVAAPAADATASPEAKAAASPLSSSAKAAVPPPADGSSPEAPAAEATREPSATPKATVEEVGVASVSKVKQQLMNRLAGTATDPLAQKKSEQGGAGKAITYLADSAKAWGGVGGGGGSGSPAPLEVKIKPGEQSFGYEELKGMRGDSGIAMASKEAYLSDTECLAKTAPRFWQCLPGASRWLRSSTACAVSTSQRLRTAMDTQDDAELDYLQSGPASTSGRSDAEQLKSALMNEKAAPEILQFETDLVNRIEATMDYQACCEAGRDEQIEMLKENDDQKLLVEIFMSELSRIRYLLRAYLRVRLQKCERHVMHILDNADIAARLSEREAQYARDFFVLFGSHMKAAAANHMPEAFSSLVRQAAAHPAKDMVPAPDLDRHVFARVLEDRGNVTVDEEGNVAEFNRGDLFVIRYRAVQQLVAEGAVELV